MDPPQAIENLVLHAGDVLAQPFCLFAQAGKARRRLRIFSTVRLRIDWKSERW